ncbi:unnamed protein product [Mytilus coruscus]|uniref:Uncharacterized protein n=1 Tax=Mytilus coruscus TaxID=42192 RepID=A0A6J8D546_MYTCO|nr:unnamed protein product [Mytilus coruscus]
MPIEETTTVASDTTLTSETTVPLLFTSEALSQGLIVGIVIGSFVLVFIAAVIFLTRRFLLEKNNLEKVDNLQGNYIGHHTIALQQSSSPPQYEIVKNTNNQHEYTNIAMTNSNECINNVENEDERKHIATLEDKTRGKYETKGNQYEVIDPTAITSFCHSKEDKPRVTENYTVLDHKETGFDRSKMSDKNQSYELAKPINTENDHYVISKEGIHACAGCHSKDDETQVTENDDERKHIAPLEDETQGKFETKGNQYEEIDPTAITSVCHSKEDKPRVTENYTVLDPKETGFDRSKMTDKKQSYELAKPINTENDHYVISKEGIHACAGCQSKDDETQVTENDDERQHIAPHEDETQGKYETKGNQYEEIDPTAITSFCHSKKDKPRVTENYTVLDPKETGFDRSKMSDKNQSDELAKPISPENAQYVMSKEGKYVCAGRSNQKELENIYNHAVDNVYDSGSYKRKDFGTADTYDHFVGQKNGR